MFRHDECHWYLQGASYVLFVDRPHTLQVDRLLPCVQHCDHAADAPEILLEDFFQIVTSHGRSFHDDAELIVDKETDVEEDLLGCSMILSCQHNAKTRCNLRNQTKSKLTQPSLLKIQRCGSSPHLHGALQLLE